MGISLKTHKLLWAYSGGKCAICKNPLIIDPADLNDDPSIIGDECHIIARNESFTRGDYDSLTPDERDHYSNLILLCKIHHKQVDDQAADFTVERLREIKRAHEESVKSLWTDADKKRQEDEIIYASYVDEWESKAYLDNWLNTSSRLNSADDLALPKEWYQAEKDFLIWLLARIWPRRYLVLEMQYLTTAQCFRTFSMFSINMPTGAKGTITLSARTGSTSPVNSILSDTIICCASTILMKVCSVISFLS